MRDWTQRRTALLESTDPPPSWSPCSLVKTAQRNVELENHMTCRMATPPSPTGSGSRPNLRGVTPVKAASRAPYRVIEYHVSSRRPS
ncbi:hypothetical protein RRG08_047552 [Elysia crispata]|uniref:Uncharacterized protein n=1 Tax=Elysia crispata TaxID=231223 RepID=A0AAE0YP39_9GAST|nr:hypothetical protein RRG08_047552 [Elysia crispata]